MITRTISQKPTKIDSEVQADWEENNPNSAAFIRHKPKLALVATSGNYDDLLNKLQAGDGVIIDGDTIFARPDNVTVELNNKGELSVIGGSTLQAGDGIEIDQGTIFAKPDNVTIDFNGQGQLSVINGSTLEAGGGIAIDDGTIFARPDNKTIIIDEDGALAAVRNPDDGGTPFEGGDGIEINRVDNTISAKVDNKTIIINTDGALAAVEGTTLEAGEGISIDQGTIHVRPDNITIDFDELGRLTVKNRTYKVTLDKDRWSESDGRYKQDITNEDIPDLEHLTADDIAVVDIVLDESNSTLAENQLSEWSKISTINTVKGGIVITCLNENPNIDLTLIFKF